MDKIEIQASLVMIKKDIEKLKVEKSEKLREIAIRDIENNIAAIEKEIEGGD